MKIAIIGSRSLYLEDLTPYLPSQIREIVTGGAEGIDRCAMEYAREKHLGLQVFLPEYKRYRRNAPLVRNRQIIDYADRVLIFWDGESRGTAHSIRYCQECGKPLQLYLVGPSGFYLSK